MYVCMYLCMYIYIYIYIFVILSMSLCLVDYSPTTLHRILHLHTQKSAFPDPGVKSAPPRSSVWCVVGNDPIVVPIQSPIIVAITHSPLPY